jgi:hypothetical protein
VSSARRRRERGDEDQDAPHYCLYEDHPSSPYKPNFDLPRLVVLSTTLALTLALASPYYTKFSPGLPCRSSKR